MSDISGERITRIERIWVDSPRPRNIGFNSRKGAHGTVVHDSVVRVHTASGAVGVGWSSLDGAAAEGLVGRRLGELFRLPDGSFGRACRSQSSGSSHRNGGSIRCLCLTGG